MHPGWYGLFLNRLFFGDPLCGACRGGVELIVAYCSALVVRFILRNPPVLVDVDGAEGPGAVSLSWPVSAIVHAFSFVAYSPSKKKIDGGPTDANSYRASMWEYTRVVPIYNRL